MNIAARNFLEFVYKYIVDNAHHQLDTEHDGEVRGEEADAAVFTLDTDHGLADEGQVDETTVRVAEGEAEELENK